MNTVKQIIDYAITTRIYRPCPPGYWFTTEYCAPIAVNAYDVPMTIFTDDLQKVPSGDYWYAPLLYLLITKPKIMRSIN